MLSYETKQVFNQIVINFFNDSLSKELQKDNIIKIAQVEDKFHITIKGTLSPSQSTLLWTNFAREANVPLELKEPEPLTVPPKLKLRNEINDVKQKLEDTLERRIEGPEPLTKPPKLELEEPIQLTEPPKLDRKEDIEEFKSQIKASVITDKKEEPEQRPLARNEIVNYLLKVNTEKGFRVSKVEIWNFVENYKKKFNRYLTKNDMEAVGIGYIQMLNQEMGIPVTEEDISQIETVSKKEAPVKPIASLVQEKLTPKETQYSKIAPKKEEAQLETIQRKSVEERGGERKKAKIFEEETLQIKTETAHLQNVSLSKKQDGILVVPKTEGRRKCPNCEESNPKMIHESIDKKVIISHFPRIYGKKYKCGNCSLEWREE